jgi:hypothetical protein
MPRDDTWVAGVLFLAFAWYMVNRQQATAISAGVLVPWRAGATADSTAGGCFR